MVTIQATYEGDLCCTSVHGPSEHTVKTDAPKDNMGLGRYFSPTDLVATALATCILTTLGIVAKRREIDLKGAEATVEKHMNAEPQATATQLSNMPKLRDVIGLLTDACRAC